MVWVGRGGGLPPPRPPSLAGDVPGTNVPGSRFPAPASLLTPTSRRVCQPRPSHSPAHTHPTPAKACGAIFRLDVDGDAPGARYLVAHPNVLEDLVNG